MNAPEIYALKLQLEQQQARAEAAEKKLDLLKLYRDRNLSRFVSDVSLEDVSAILDGWKTDTDQSTPHL